VTSSADTFTSTLASSAAAVGSATGLHPTTMAQHVYTATSSL